MEPSSSKTQSSPGRHAAKSRRSSLQRAALIVLIVGAVAAVALALGPVWVVRAGVAVAIIAGVIATIVSFKDLRQQKLETERRLIAQSREHGATLTEERKRNGEVVSSLRQSNVETTQRLRVSRQEAHDAQVRIVQLNGTIGKLNSELSSLRGNNAALRQDMRERDRRLKELTAELEATKAELAAMTRQAAADEQDEVAPRYAQTGSRVWEKLPTAEELWADGNYPTVVDLQKLAFPVAESAPRRKHA